MGIERHERALCVRQLSKLCCSLAIGHDIDNIAWRDDLIRPLGRRPGRLPVLYAASPTQTVPFDLRRTVKLDKHTRRLVLDCEHHCWREIANVGVLLEQ